MMFLLPQPKLSSACWRVHKSCLILKRVTRSRFRAVLKNLPACNPSHWILRSVLSTLILSYVSFKQIPNLRFTFCSMASTHQNGRDWPKFTSLWSSPLAKSFLSVSAPLPLPTSGPLHNMLAATRKICKKEHTRRSAEEAVKAGAVWVLAEVVHWLQQSPCHELLTASILDPHGCAWYTVLHQLTTLVQEVKTSCSRSIQLDCCKQLEQAAGKCISSLSNAFLSTSILPTR
jgi:hypothetical protein